MITLSFNVLDLDFPAGSRNKTVTGEGEHLPAFEEELGRAADGPSLTEALVKRCPERGGLIVRCEQFADTELVRDAMTDRPSRT
ncbi:hypothetical protein [Streptomyces sp. NPDC019937]|uniref:hypothetical protein n=1 Tax=Streptomyces sp. NPDC019937 TaxID=3154787 RepID=UPI0033CF33C3